MTVATWILAIATLALAIDGGTALLQWTDRLRPRAYQARTRQPAIKVITSGVTPSLHVDCKHATIKQYRRKDERSGPRPTINDTRDFGIGKRLTSLPALREVGFSAPRRLLRLERLSHDLITGAEAVTAVTGPVLTDGRTRIPGLPSVSHAARRSSPLYSSSGCYPAASPTVTCANSPPNCAACPP